MTAPLLENHGDNWEAPQAYLDTSGSKCRAFPRACVRTPLTKGDSRSGRGVTAVGHEERFPARRLSGRCGFRKRSVAVDD